MADSDNYYRERAVEEMAAAERSGDPSISQIHRELARLYSDMIGIRMELSGDHPGGAAPLGGAFDERVALLD
jgi:hypothetical protein